MPGHPNGRPIGAFKELKMKKRRLSDLYVRGKALEISDGQGPPVEVWIAKINDIDRASVVRRAQAAKARYMIDADNEESDVFAAMYSSVREYDERDTLVRIVTGEDARRARLRVEAQLYADEETWGKDGYLQGLFDAWVGTDEEPGLARAIAEDPDDPEANRVKAELDRFEEEVQAAFEPELQRLIRDWDDADDETLWRSATHKVLERRGDEEFLKEAERQQIFHAVRSPEDHSKRYFGSVAEIDDLDERVRTQLVNAVNAMTVDLSEGKDSPRTPDSSPSSESQDAATQEPSGPQALSA